MPLPRSAEGVSNGFPCRSYGSASGRRDRPTLIWLTPSRASIILAGTAPNQVLELGAHPNPKIGWLSGPETNLSFEAPLEQVSAPPMAAIELFGVVAIEIAHAAGEVRDGRVLS
jgi:hypothetical protein